MEALEARIERAAKYVLKVKLLPVTIRDADNVGRSSVGLVDPDEDVATDRVGEGADVGGELPLVLVAASDSVAFEIEPAILVQPCHDEVSQIDVSELVEAERQHGGVLIATSGSSEHDACAKLPADRVTIVGDFAVRTKCS